MEDKYEKALDMAIREFEIDLEDDCNNEWLKREIEDLKEVKKELKRYKEITDIIKKHLTISKVAIHYVNNAIEPKDIKGTAIEENNKVKEWLEKPEEEK